MTKGLKILLGMVSGAIAFVLGAIGFNRWQEQKESAWTEATDEVPF